MCSVQNEQQRKPLLIGTSTNLFLPGRSQDFAAFWTSSEMPLASTDHPSFRPENPTVRPFLPWN